MSVPARAILRCGLVLLVVAAVVISLVRLALAQPALITPWAEGVVTAVMDEPARFGRAAGRLNGVSPELVLHDVRVGDAEREVRFESLRLRLDAWASLAQMEPVLAGLHAAGARLRVTRHDDGSVRVQGRRENLFAKIPFPEHLSLTDFAIDWRDGGPSREPLRLRSVRIQARSAGDGVRLRGGARIGEEGGRIRLSAALDSLPRASGPFAGQVHVGLTDVDTARLTEAGSRALDDTERLIAGRLQGGVWLNWDSNKLNSVTAAGGWHEPGVGELALPGRLEGSLHWRREGAGWRLSARGTGEADATRLALAYDGAAQGWRLGARELPVGPWKTGLSSRMELPEPANRILTMISAEGRVARLLAGWRGQDWRTAGRVTDASLIADGARPGLSAFDAEWRADRESGELRVALADSTLRWPRVLREPVDQLSGEGLIGWRREGERFDIRLTDAAWSSSLMAATASGGFSFGGSDEPRLQGTVNLRRANAAALLDRLTPKVRAAGSLEWLARSLERGTVTGARLDLDGPLSQLPFRGPDAQTRLRLGFRDARLAYADDWPALASVAGDVSLSRAGLRIGVRRGSLAGVALQQGQARIPDLEAPELSVTAEARGGFPAWRALAEQTPLTVPRPLKRLRGDGEPELRLELGFPLDGTGLASVAGRVALNGSSVTEPDTGYRLDALEGSVAFDQDGVRWDGVTGRLRGQRVTSKGWTENGGEEARIRTATRVDAAATELLPSDWADQLPTEGRASWLLHASLPRWGPGRWRMELSSELDGLAVDVPAPLGKARSQARGLSVTASGGPEGLDPLRLRYGDVLDAVLAIEGGRVRRGALRLGGERAELPSQRGLRVSGRLGDVDVARMRSYAALFAGREGAERLPPLTGIDLQVAGITVGGLTVRDLGVSVEQSGGGWRVALSGPNARGMVRIGEAGSVAAELERLRLERRRTDGETRTAPAPTAVPDLDVRIANLRLDGRGLGQLRLRLRDRGGSLELVELVLDNPSMLLRASGEWRREADRSELAMTLETVDGGAVLERFGAERSMRRGSGRMSAELAWDGHLLAPDVASLDGGLELDLRDGSLPTLEPGAGRVFGMLSLSLLPRRLMLDFGAVTDEGLPFDRIRAAFAIEDGLASPDPCYLTGPMANIAVSGSVDLVDRVYDQRVTVTPRISPTLPLVGGLAAGPAAALLLLLGQDVVAEGVAPLTTLEYRLTGHWAAPRLERVRAGVL